MKPFKYLSIMKSNRKIISEALDVAHEAGLKEIEKLARTVLRRNDKLEYFYMGMGTWFFSYKNDNDYTLNDFSKQSYLVPLQNFMQEYDCVFKFTGLGVRFTVDGPLDYNW